MNYTREQLNEKIKNLPEDVKNAIFSINSAEIIKNVGEKHGLHIDKIGDLGAETGYVMYGITPPKDFVTSLAKKLSLPEDKARAIAQDVNEQIFRPIRESLQKIHGVVAGETQAKTVAEKILEKSFVPKKPEVKIPPYIPPIPPRQNTFVKKPEQVNASSSIQKPESESLKVSTVTQPSSGFPTENSKPDITAHVEAYQKKMEEKAKKDNMNKSQELSYEEASNISKESLLQDIENPTAIKKEISSVQNPIIKEYSNDPYREPIN